MIALLSDNGVLFDWRILRRLSALDILADGNEPHPLPRIGDVERYFIRQRPYFIADFLIRSIIRTRLFNDYLGSLTNTPVIQRLLGCLTITAEQNASIRAKSTKPRRRIALRRGSFMLKNGKSLDFKRFSGVEKVHRNSIKITVDLWCRWWDSNPHGVAPGGF